MSTRSIKMHAKPTVEQSHVFNSWLLAQQLFRNDSVKFLRQRHANRKQWIQANKHTTEYLTYQKDIELFSEKMKAFNQTYKTKADRQQAEEQKLKPVYPKPIHDVFVNDIEALSKQLTQELDEAKNWLFKTLPRHIAKKITSPKSISTFFNALPLSLRKTLRCIAKNEVVKGHVLNNEYKFSSLADNTDQTEKATKKEILATTDQANACASSCTSTNIYTSKHPIKFYLLQVPRTVLDQTVQDLHKTRTQAFENLKKGKPVIECGFPQLRKIKRHGGIRVQVDSRNKEFVSCWKNQQLYIPGFGIIDWTDHGYMLPDDPAKMITLKTSTTGQLFVSFTGNPTYNDKRQQQAKRSALKKQNQTLPPAQSVNEFLGVNPNQLSHTAAFDINRFAGQIVIVSNEEQTIPDSYFNQFLPQDKQEQIATTEQENLEINTLDKTKNSNTKNYTVSLLGLKEEEKYRAKLKRTEQYIAYQQQHLNRQDRARKNSKRKGRSINPNGLHRKGKHSHNRLKTQAKINRAYESMFNLKEFYLLALAQKMIAGKRVIFIEDLDVKGMQEKERDPKTSDKQHKNNKHSQHTANFGRFIAILKEVCDKNNVTVLQCHRYDPSSQICHLCGYQWGKLDTSIRTIQCAECHVVHDRDYNASMNIKFMALYRYWQGLDKPKISQTKSKNTQDKIKHTVQENMSSLEQKQNNGSAERVDPIEVNDFTKISHEELWVYLEDNYPIERVKPLLDRVSSIDNEKRRQHEKTLSHKDVQRACEKDPKKSLSAPCGKRHHAIFSQKTVRKTA